MQAQLPPANQLLAQVWELIRHKDIQHAVNACQLMNQQYPEHANGWYASSFLALQLGGHDHALKSIDRALSLQPGNQRWLLQKAACLQAAGLKQEAIILLRETASNDYSDRTIWAEIGLLASSLEQHDLSLKMFGKAIELNPDQGRLHFNLATVHRFLGDLGQAESSCNRAIELDAGDYDAVFLRSSLRKQSAKDNHIQELLSVAESIDGNANDNTIGNALVNYSLAKEYEDLGESENSFKALQKGADARRSSLQYDIEADIEFIDAIIDVYSKEFMSTVHKGHNSSEPIFVLGLPRTGTTLVERILGSHDSVISAGELTNFTRHIASMAQLIGQQTPGSQQAGRNDMVRMTTRIDYRLLGEAYIKSTRPLTGQVAYFIDKFPQNTLNIGPIRLALPGAKIILLQRDPMDSCYSMYKQLFTDIYQFSYDLQELGQYFIAHQRLLNHWLDVAGDAIHVVHYEKLVTDTEAQVRSLIGFCELPWQDQCLDFHKNTQASTTASASQIRQKLYASSIGKWQDYEQQLEPLRKMLDEAGCL